MAHSDAGRGSEGEIGVLFTLPQNMVHAALLPLMRTHLGCQ